MYPELFHLGSLTIYSYGFCIMLGAFAAYYYAIYQSKPLGLSQDTISVLALILVASAYVGGKVFLWFSDWDYFISHPKAMFSLSGSGFVFYGSFIFCMISLYVFFKQKRIAALPMLDILAVSTALVHGMGKIGCFLAGCCYGKICAPAIGVVYHHAKSSAEPLHQPLYPVQLIDALVLLSAALFLHVYRTKKQFNGQLMLLYIFIYGTNRFFTEFLRGDDDRGFIGTLSQSQWVSIVLLVIAAILYRFGLRMRKS